MASVSLRLPFQPLSPSRSPLIPEFRRRAWRGIMLLHSVCADDSVEPTPSSQVCRGAIDISETGPDNSEHLLRRVRNLLCLNTSKWQSDSACRKANHKARVTPQLE
eukprot:CAMPEP_0196743206 /NCGR_PEP_ID=MMETSP1091-20130531/51384_1 /TAXON_ID=302021 /ORGANISM="Rhodomonas sp., Strain CCMP768" /LENGTH=105 /DNA_ID=CAMNT_0042089495 /DNA_START=517 /DNA_END=834 /DNA_ORIENTATION=+